ncbi:MAG: glycosyltransferase family 2 protein [Niabella sp.]
MIPLKISIITVCYNAEKTIRNTIESVLQQRGAEIEYIVIDGNSKDDTLRIVNGYKDQISSVVSEPDKGLYDAMNKGIELAAGDYIGILNADDVFYENNTIHKVSDFLSKNTDVDAIIGDIVQTNGKKIVRKYSSKRWTPDKLKIGFMPPHPSIFFKRELFKKFGNYNLKYSISADYELITRFFLKHTISYKYSGITTTFMLRGGASSSGIRSYQRITKQICTLLEDNSIGYSPLAIQMRFLWKILEFLKK